MAERYHDADLDWTPGGAIDPSSPSFGDWIKQLEASAHGTAAAINSGVSTLSNETGYSDGAQLAAINARLNRGSARDITESMTPAGRQAAEGDFAHHLISAPLFMGTGMLPAAAVGAAGGMAGAAVGGAVGAGGALAAGLGAGAANAALSVGQGIEDIAGKSDAVPDDELRKQATEYDGYRDLMPEPQARLAFRDFLATDKGRVVANALAGFIGGGLGVAGKIGGQVAGGALLHGAEAAAGGAIQGGVNTAVSESQDVAGGFANEGDPSRVAESVLTGGAIGLVAGAAHGYFTGERSPRKYPKERAAAQATASEATASEASTITPPNNVVDVTEAAALKAKLGAEKAPPPAEPVQPPKAAEAPPSPPQAQETPTGTPAPPVTTEGNAPPTPAVDAAIPEDPNSLVLQQRELTSGKRDVMKYTAGEQLLPLPKGYTRVQIGPDTYDFNPGVYTKGAVLKLVQSKKIGEALGLGPVTKEQAIASEAQGAPPVAVTERAPDGTEVKAAAGTTKTAPVQLAAIDAQKAPGNTAQVESPAKVLAERKAAQPVTNTLAKIFSPGEVEQARAKTAPQVTRDNPWGVPLDEPLHTLKLATPPRIHEDLGGGQTRSGTVNRVSSDGDWDVHWDSKGPGDGLMTTITKAYREFDDTVHPEVPKLAAQPRVLPDVSKGEAIRAKAQAAANAAHDKQVSKALKAPSPDEEKAKVGRKDFTPADVAKRQVLNRAAQEIVEAHPPGPTEVHAGADSGPGKIARMDMSARAKAMLKAFADRGFELPGSVKDNKNPEHDYSVHVSLLKQAVPIAKRKATLAEYQLFLVKHELARVGDRATLVKLKREDDATKFGGLGSGGMENAEARPAESEHEPITSGVSHELVVQPDALREEPPSEEDAPHAPATAALRKVEADKAEVQTRIAARRAEGKGESAGEAPAPRADMSKVQVATTKRRTIPVSARVAKMAVGDDWSVPVSGKEGTLPVTASGTLADAIGELGLKRNDPAGVMSSYVAGKLLARVGHIETHFVEGPSMDAVVGKLAGFYDPKLDHIVLRTDIAPEKRAHVILHEALHAALYHAIEADPKAKNDIRMLMREFSAATNGRLDGAYAFTNEHEFISEFLSSPRIQELAARTPLSGLAAARLGLGGKARTLWNGIIQAFARALGLSKDHISVLDGIVSVAERLGLGESGRRADVGNVTREHSIAAIRLDPEEEKARPELLGKVTNQIAEKFSHALPGLGDSAKEKFLKLLPFDQMRQMHEHLFGGDDEKNPLRRLGEALNRASTRFDNILHTGDNSPDKLSARMQISRREDPENFGKLVSTMIDSTIRGVHADAPLDSGRNSHLRLAKGKKGDAEGAKVNWQARAAHPELSARYGELSPANQAIYRDARSLYEGLWSQKVRLALRDMVHNIDPPAGLSHAEAFKRVTTGALTDKDVEHYNTQRDGFGDALKRFGDTERKGPYFPLSRHGDYVVSAERKYTAPTNATPARDSDTSPVIPHTYDFNTRKEAHEFMTRKGALPSKVETVYFDPAKPDNPKTTKSGGLSTAGGPTQKYRVSIMAKQSEHFDTEHEANARHKELQADSGITNLKAPDKTRLMSNTDWSVNDPQIASLAKVLAQRSGLSAADQEQVLRHLTEGQRALEAGNALSRHMMTRRNVAGASEQAIRNLSAYAHSSASYLSRAEFRPEIDQAFKEMDAHVEEGRASGDEKTIQRRRILQEAQQRVLGIGSPEYMSKLGPFWSRLMAISFMKRMASTAHLALHMLHPIMTSLPIIGGRHGAARAARELYRAYRDMGALGGLKEGAKGAKNVALHDTQATNFGAFFRKELKGVGDSAQLNRMFDALEATGHLHPDAGFDVSRYSENKTAFDRALGRSDRTLRELTGATESINRYATAITAYRLAIKDGEGHEAARHEAALRYTKDTISNTQGLFTRGNAPPAFQGRAKPFLQFKQYPLMLTTLLARTASHALHGDKVAMKQLGLMLGTAATLTGVNGLPSEVIKIPWIAAGALGLTDTTFDDATDALHRELAREFGTDIGSLLMNGISTLGPFAGDIHHRAGMSSMWTFGDPDPAKRDDIKNWLSGLIFGAPMSLLADTIDGAHALMSGDWVKAVEKLSPVKQVGDAAKAANEFMEGKPTASGKPGMRPLTIPETITQTFGITPRAAADYSTGRFQAGRAIRAREEEARAKKLKLGPSGQRILGYAKNKNNADILTDYGNAYGGK